ncbi:hypothetical protein HDU87_002610 [Geranomyces variabilis]|uniref:Uncharacterized protein n=1 Tax=Geranomyces variabilis TaxID=109894 RepID=A0AAD5XUR4_9FUNG|nr:hypothetical protein HDU87_002610 [Geranomyces variabilis]
MPTFTAVLVTTALVIATWFLYTFVLSGITTRYGLSIEKIRPTFLSDITYRPLEPRSPSRDSASKRPALALASVQVESLWMEFHRPTENRRSWISVRVAGPTIVFENYGTDAHKRPQKRAKLPKGLILRIVLDKLGRVLRNGVIRIVFHVFDARIDRLQVLVLESDGRVALRYFQEYLALTLHSKLEPSEPPASAPKGKGRHQKPNVRIELAISPCEVTSSSRDSETPSQLFVLDSSSSITFTAHATVLGRVGVPSLDVRINGMSVACSEIARLARQFSPLNSTEESDPNCEVETPPWDDEAKDLIASHLHMLQSKLLELTDIRPTVQFHVSKTTLSFEDSGFVRELSRNTQAPLALVIMEEITYNADTIAPSAEPGLVFHRLAVKGIYVDICHLPFLRQTTCQAFSASMISLEMKIPVACPLPKDRRASRTERFIPPLALNPVLKLHLELPRVLLSDHLIAWLIDESRHRPRTPVKRRWPRPAHLASITRRHWMMDRIFRSYRPTIEVTVADPALVVQILGYDVDGPESERAFLMLSVEDISLRATVSARALSDPDLNKAVSTDSLMVAEVTLALRSIQVSGTKGSVDEMARGFPEAYDVLAFMESVDVTSQIAPPTTPSADAFIVHFNLNCDVGQASVDLSQLPKSEHLDYFQLVARITSLRRRPRPKAHTVTVPDPHPVIAVTSYLQVSTASIGVLFVGEDQSKATFFEVQSIAWARSAYHAKETTGGDGLRLLLSSRLEINSIGVRSSGAFEPNGDYSSMREQFFVGEYVDVCLQSRRIHVFTAGDEDGTGKSVPTITTDEIISNLSLRAVFVALKSALYIVKLVKLFDFERKQRAVDIDCDRNPDRTLVEIAVDSVIIYLLLPEDVPLRVSIEGLDVRLDAAHGTEITTEAVGVEVKSDETKMEYAQLLGLQTLNIGVKTDSPEGDHRKRHKTITVGIGDVRAFVPYAFKMFNVIENAINLQKAIKELAHTELGTRAARSCSSRGRTRLNAHIPTVLVKVAAITLELEDDPFESILSRNYMLGMEQQEGRLARDKAFQNKAAALRHIEEKKFGSIVMGARQSPEVESAWWMLQEFNSRAWIAISQGAKQGASVPPPLMTATFTNLLVSLTVPTLPADTIEESLNLMDPTTPPHALYAELVPRYLVLSLDEVTLQIRDYSLPLVHIPKTRISKWTTQGLLIIAEQALQTESKRSVSLPLRMPSSEQIIVTRAVNPTKLYTSFETTITNDATVLFCWGASTEPGIADMMGVFDNFTKPNVDPSAPIGWWDKLRLIAHGHNVIHITGGGDVKFRMLGSCSPYFNALKHWGTEGLAICLRDGIRIDINGSNVPGEDVTIESGELALSLPASSSKEADCSDGELDDTIASFAGGIKVALGFDFFLHRPGKGGDLSKVTKRTHAEIALRAPEFCSADELQMWDSFKGFRTRSIHVTINIESPRPFYASLPEPLNALSLTMETLSRFFTFTQVYQSVLTSLPIRRGKLFQEAGPGPSKQKLGRVIGTIRLITCIYPLLAGFVAEPRERDWGVGFRCRAEQMNVDMTLVQRVIRQRRPKEELLKRKSATKWLLSTSEIELIEVEARAVASGSIEDAKKDLAMDGSASPAGEGDSDSDDHDWYFASDYARNGGEYDIKMVPFAWAPRIIYFKRNDANTSSAHDSMRARRDIYSIQKTLFKSRMREIEASIRHYLDVQKGLEYRMAVFFDDSLRQQSQIIVEKMAVLHEKKVVIEQYIRDCQKKMDVAANPDSATNGRAEPKLPASALFKHHFIVHNVNLLWKKDVRNILFQMITLQQRRLAIKYCLSNTATRVMTQLVTSVAEKRIILDPMENFDPDRPPDTPKAAPPPVTKNSTMEVLNMDANGARKLLAKLLNEVDTSFTVANESSVEDDGMAHSPSSEVHTAAIASSKRSYVASRDPESPDYVAENQTFESEYIVVLIHPQVNLEAESKDDPTHLESVVVAAESMQLRSVLILDARASNSQNMDENADRNEEIIKSRMVLKIQDAQLFVTRLADIAVAPEFDLDNIVMHRAGTTAATGHGGMSTPWPVWVPIECLIDHSSHSGHLHRVVERISASFNRDVPNPLYLKGDNATSDPESTQTIYMNFPTFSISANAAQYMVIHDVIENLLVYKDSVKGEYAEKLKKMLLVLEQMEDLRKVQETVVALQQKIRQADVFLKCGGGNGPEAHSQHSDEVVAARRLEILRHLAQYQDELVIIIHALKAMQMLEQKKKSAAVSLQTSIRVEKMVWLMVHDDDMPLCEWALEKAQFSFVQHEDQSSINTLHIDQLHLENHMSAPQNAFKEVIAPYNPDKRDVDFTRHKMIRVYWREMAPVAGIKVVDHFEVNIFPLLIQVTYDMVKEIIYYLFPEKKARAAAKDPHHQAPTATDDRLSRRFPRSDSSDQLTVRSAKSISSEHTAAAMMRRHSSISMDEMSTGAHSSRASSASESEVSPQLDRKRIFKTSAFSNYGHSRSGSGRSENRDDDDGTPTSTTGRDSPISPKPTRRSTTKLNELKQMQARASQNRSFIYIKMPGAQHCLSYRGSKEKNIEDLFMFAFKMPTLEFRNKTWTWLDFLDAVKKEALRAVLANTGALVREKLFQKRRTNAAQAEHAAVNMPDTHLLAAPPLPQGATAPSLSATDPATASSIFSASSSTGSKPSKFNPARSMFSKTARKESEKDKEKEKEHAKKPKAQDLIHGHHTQPLQPLHDAEKQIKSKKHTKEPSTELLFEIGEDD